MSGLDANPKSLRLFQRLSTPVLLGGLVALIGVLVAVVAHFASDPGIPSSSEQLAALDARTKAYTETFSKTYSATDVNYDGSTVIMTVDGQSYKCEAPAAERLADRPELRCETLTVIKPANTEVK